MPRGRPIGSGARDLEPCPKHPGSRVVKNGRYGKPPHRRQMFKCYPKGPASPHNFAGETPRSLSETGLCEHCENHLEAHEGPRHPSHYEFPVAQAAEALVLVGQGMSYTETAQLVANFVEVLGPVVVAPHAETAWPETLVLDSTWFMTETPDGKKMSNEMYAILVAYGYPAGTAPGRVWAVKASHGHGPSDWKRLLGSLPGTPKLVISDGDASIHTAVSEVWPTTFVKLCEHHLRQGILTHLRHYGMLDDKGKPTPLLDDAFHSVRDWRAFVKAVRGPVMVDDWIERHEATVVDQASRRSKLPDHHSTGAAEGALSKVRTIVEPRAFSYRNAARTNLMLELVRLSLNKCDDSIAYGTSIRSFLATTKGKLPRQGVIRDKADRHSLH